MWRTRPRVGDELRFHRERLIEDFVAQGMDRHDAERRAFLEFGNVAGLEETVRDVRGRWLNDFSQDLAYAVRALRRAPGFAAVAILLLALAIGANTAIFSLVNAILLRPLPVPRPGELVQITRVSSSRSPLNVSYPLFETLRDHVQSISRCFAMETLQVSAAIGGVDEFLRADAVSGDYFTVLELTPAAGRLLAPFDDDLGTASPAAVISDAYWQRRFGRNTAALGTSVAIRGRVFTIVGVMPPPFESAIVGDAPDIVLPLRLMLSEEQRTEPTSNFLKLVGRLKGSSTVAQADGEAQRLFRAFIEPIAAAVPSTRRSGLLNQRAGALAARDGVNPFRADLTNPLTIVMGLVLFILLLACVNVSGLLLARATARAREVSIRLAIGAGRGRLIRQFLAESLVLVSIAGAIGIVIATQLTAGLVAMFLNGREIALSIAPDWRVALFAAAVALMSTLLAGLLPALHAVRAGLIPALKRTRWHGPGRTGKALVVAQFAISMILTVGATLFVDTLVSLYRVDRGFDSDGLTVVSVRSERAYPDDRVIAVSNALLESLRRMPRAQGVAAAAILPVDGNLWVPAIEVGDSLHPGDSDAAFNVVSPKYFATLRTPILAGREFDDHDTLEAPRVAVVNAAFVRYFFGNQSALGRRVKYRNQPYEIVGVAGDAKYEDLRSAAPRTFYIPTAQREIDQPASYRFIIRTAGGEAANLEPAIAAAVHAADPGLRVRTTMPYSAVIGRTLPAERILATLGGLFGVVAVLVAAIGMFGLLAFQVARRTNELGLRLALGANPRSMMGLVFADMARMLAIGIAIGAAGAAPLAALARGLVFGLATSDPRVYMFAASVLTASALLAGWLPARRAARIDPLTALRAE